MVALGKEGIGAAKDRCSIEQALWTLVVVWIVEETIACMGGEPGDEGVVGGSVGGGCSGRREVVVVGDERPLFSGESICGVGLTFDGDRRQVPGGRDGYLYTTGSRQSSLS